MHHQESRLQGTLPRYQLTQEEYRANLAQMYIAPLPPIEFWVGGRKGIKVVDALVEQFDGLHDPDARLLDNVGTKMSVRIAMPGYPPFVRSKYVHRSTTTHESISRKQLATRLAEVVEAFVNASGNVVSDRTRWRFGPGYIELTDLYITEVRHVSKGSMQPVLEYDYRPQYSAGVGF